MKPCTHASTALSSLVNASSALATVALSETKISDTFEICCGYSVSYLYMQAASI